VDNAIRDNQSRRPEDSPTAWFVELERALEKDNFQRAAEAKRQLERLGVRVSFRQPRRRIIAKVKGSRALSPPARRAAAGGPVRIDCRGRRRA
jgi:hypothetical protein